MGITYIDMRERKEGFGMIETVRKNFEGFTKEEILKSKLYRKTQSMVGNPPAVRFKETVSDEGLRNFPVEVNDVTNSSAIFGPNRNRLGGESTRRKPKRAREEYMKIPRYFYRLNNFVTLAADVMFVNSIPFLVTFSRKIILITVEHVPTRTVGQLSKYLINIVKLYARGGFVIRLMFNGYGI